MKKIFLLFSILLISAFCSAQNLELIPAPDSLMYNGEPIEYKGVFYGSFYSSKGGRQICKYNGDSLNLISDSLHEQNNNQSSRSAIVFKDKLYFFYNFKKIYRYDGQELTEIDLPAGYSFGGNSGAGPIIYKGKLYFRLYKDSSFEGPYLYSFDDTLFDKIIHPSIYEGADSEGRNKGYHGSPIIVNDNLFLRYHKGEQTYDLVQYDGVDFTTIPTPVGSSYSGRMIAENGNLYLAYHSGGTNYNLYKYDLSALTKMKLPQGYKYYGDPFSFKEDIYFTLSRSSDGSRALSYANEDSALIIPNPVGYNSPFYNVEYKNNLFLQFNQTFNSNQKDLFKLDGNSWIKILSPVGLSYYGSPFVYGENLYLMYREVPAAFYGIYHLYGFDNKELFEVTYEDSFIREPSGYFGSPIAVDERLFLRFQLNDGSYQLMSLTDNLISSVGDVDQSSFFSMYPNPASSEVNLNLFKSYDGLRIKITDIYGKIHIDKELGNSSEVLLKLNLESGSYIVSIYSDEGLNGNRKLIIK